MGRLALPRLFDLESNRSAIPDKPHAGLAESKLEERRLVGDPGLAPGRLDDFKSPGSAVPAKASRRKNKSGRHGGTWTPKAARF